MRFGDLPTWLRRPFVLAMGATFAWLVFFEGPAEAMQLNESWGWPRWSGSVTRLLGEFLWFGHAALLGYTALYFVAAQAVILWGEEPVLRRRFGEEYAAYAQRVRRWL